MDNLMEKLYGNIGRKIKLLAFVSFIVEAIGGIVVGFVMMGNASFPVGLLIVIVSPIVAFIASWLLYGLGQLIENSELQKDGINKLSTSVRFAANNHTEQAKRGTAAPAPAPAAAIVRSAPSNRNGGLGTNTAPVREEEKKQQEEARLLRQQKLQELKENGKLSDDPKLLRMKFAACASAAEMLALIDGEPFMLPEITDPVREMLADVVQMERFGGTQKDAALKKFDRLMADLGK